MKKPRRVYSATEMEYVAKHYSNNYAKDIAPAIGLTELHVYRIAAKLGLKKDPEFLKKELARQGEKLTKMSIHTRFKKGQVPFNKGQKVSREMYDKMKASMFKPGHKPKNYMPIGSERIEKQDGYVQVKVKRATWVFKHRVIWEKHFGPIPQNHMVIFKDGNKRNFDIDNLALITLQENMQRNTIHNYPEELVDTMKLLKKLKRKIYEEQDHRPTQSSI
jgi:hypothetical protein